MWIRRRSYFLVIRIQAPGRLNIMIPVSLVVLEQLLVAWFELVDVVRDLFPVHRLRFPWSGLAARSGRKELSVGDILALLRSLWSELRSYGRWKMVDIESEEARVEIRFF